MKILVISLLLVINLTARNDKSSAVYIRKWFITNHNINTVLDSVMVSSDRSDSVILVRGYMRDGKCLIDFTNITKMDANIIFNKIGPTQSIGGLKYHQRYVLIFGSYFLNNLFGKTSKIEKIDFLHRNSVNVGGYPPETFESQVFSYVFYHNKLSFYRTRLGGW